MDKVLYGTIAMLGNLFGTSGDVSNSSGFCAIDACLGSAFSAVKIIIGINGFLVSV
jgi:hypothetical protein